MNEPGLRSRRGWPGVAETNNAKDLRLPTPLNATIDGKRETGRAHPRQPTFLEHMRRQLAGVLGAGIEDLPLVFHASAPKPLKIGAYQDLLERFPEATPRALHSWIRQWCQSRQYLAELDRGG